MSKTTILVTSVGSAPAIAVIKGLRRSNEPGLNIIGVDADPTAVGFALVDKPFVIPSAKTEAAYRSSLSELIRRHDVRTIFPILEDELFLYSSWRDELKSLHVTAILNSAETLEVCFDKLRFHEFAKKHRWPVPPTHSTEAMKSLRTGFPIVLKPRKGRRQSDVAIANDSFELKHWTEKSAIEIVGQEFVSGVEITVEVLCDPRGQFVHSVARERLQVKSGVATKARFFMDPKLTSMARELTKTLPVTGPFNFQVIRNLEKDKDWLIDVNPKFPGGGGLSVKAGQNFPLWLFQLAQGIRPEKLILPKTLDCVVGVVPEEVVLPGKVESIV